MQILEKKMKKNPKKKKFIIALKINMQFVHVEDLNMMVYVKVKKN